MQAKTEPAVIGALRGLAIVQPDNALPTVIACIDATLRRFGGCPTYALTDNEKTVTTTHVARIAFRNPDMVAASRHYGLTIATCVVADPESKGGSEATVRVAKADPWSVMKVSFLLSIALGICTIVAAAVLWMVMDAMGVFSTVGGTISEATGSNESNGFDLQAFLSLPRVLIFTSIIAVIDVVLATALATLGAFIYNLSAGFVGGVELTLAEDE